MSENNTSVGILAHVDAGKTTLSEQLLYHCGTLRSVGRVDEQSTCLDHDEIERRRGITVFSDQSRLSVGRRDFTLIDTPGHTDFSGEMERSLSVLDCAVLVVSAVEGVQAHTETLWQLLKERNVPTFVFINKTDRTGADITAVMSQLSRLSSGFCDLTGITESGVLPETSHETLAETDDELLEAYLSGTLENEVLLKKARLLTAERKLFPVFCGSALKDVGIDGLIFGLELLAPAPLGSAQQPFSGLVYKVRHDKGGRVVYIKVESGTLHPKDMIDTPAGSEKCNELRAYTGAKFELLKSAPVGTLCAVTGLSTANVGDRVGQGACTSERFTLRPLLSSTVIFDHDKTPPPVMLAHFRELEDEEPLLSVSWSEQVQEIQVQVMGEIQLEVITDIVLERWGIEVSFAPCSVLYRETISAPVVGVGHFEPLRHYAEVHLLLLPAKPGSGIIFSSRCPHDALATNWQNLVRTHVLEKQHRGVLTGSPLTDVEIVLLSGRAHIKHTEGGDFRESTYRAVRQGLMNAQSVLLEPYYEFTAETAMDEIGRVQSDLTRMEALCDAPCEADGRMSIHGYAPVRTMMEYPKEFSALTHGRGRLSLRFGGYRPCHDPKPIIEAAAYEPERDLENTPDSVFCSHGAGFPVKWSEAPSYMHLPIESPPAAEQ